MKIGSLILWSGDDDIKNGYGIVFKEDYLQYWVYWIDIKRATFCEKSSPYIEVVK